MGLAGLEIYKLLPKTNCRKCNFPTCLAFALALAKKTTDITKCPFLTDEAKAALESSSQPPVKLITIGKEEDALSVGNETVLFRHEEKFHHPTGIGLIIEDNTPQAELSEFVKFLKGLEFERVGQELKLDLIAIKDTSGDIQTFSNCVKFVKENSKLNLVFISKNPEIIKAAIEICKDEQPLIFGADENNHAQFAEIANNAKAPLVVSASSLDDLHELVKKLKQRTCEDLVLHVENNSLAAQIEGLTQIRRLALKKTFRPFGFPTISVIKAGESVFDVLNAGALMAKYASIILLEKASVPAILSLLTLRQNIYSDPQRPLQVEPKIYPIGSPTNESPLLVTTNFSLTYYTVLSEVESSKISSYILSVDTEGMSVLTAWAAEKFTPEKITQSMQKASTEQLVNHKIVIIPGYVAVMSGDLEEQSGWKVMVGPREASGISAFLKNFNN
ncbi:MAG: acetyl-CoA decarbonylase/synthase complex subunit gamma [Candidatus Omnitrophica bacterium]|nr:acetyl-CoA decarbonylase/synthase complex subunit gamma [Candidatus Omnitrophota bacterium]